MKMFRKTLTELNVTQKEFSAISCFVAVLMEHYAMLENRTTEDLYNILEDIDCEDFNTLEKDYNLTIKID